MNERIHVWRDAYTAYEHVGTISAYEDHVTFAYAGDYQGPAISYRLPVRVEPFSERETEVFFSALVPEGQTRVDFLDALRANRNEYAPLIERLNNESSGGLVFSSGDEMPGTVERYSPLEQQFFERLAKVPRQTATEAVGKTRLSLAGAMAKVGLYRDETSGRWLYPEGSAPSTHIVKAGDAERFPHEILNEALCLETARLCELPVESYELIPTESNPLLAVRRFDRVIPDSPRRVDGHARPLRLHQEDLCQLGGIKQKYEPSEGHYLTYATSHTGAACSNSFGEKMLVLYYVFFDYLMGNCDNHLKNISVLYASDWSSREVAPLYDVIDTTVYEGIKDTMGISLCPSRSIFDVTRDEIAECVRHAGMPESLAMREFDALAEEVMSCFDQACENVVGDGYPQAEKLVEAMRHGIKLRASFAFSEENRICIA